jgi:hypothetical protein
MGFDRRQPATLITLLGFFCGSALKLDPSEVKYIRMLRCRIGVWTPRRFTICPLGPVCTDFVAKVGYGGWTPVSRSTIDDRL